MSVTIEDVPLVEKRENGVLYKEPDVESPGPGGRPPVPTLFGFPMKYVSLLTLSFINTFLNIVMRYSRVIAPASQAYSPATAVLLIDILKAVISFVTVFARMPVSPPYSQESLVAQWRAKAEKLRQDIFTSDCWKLSLPSILYVALHNLQYIAISNLDAATYQVTYQMKILTTAAFSVLLLRKEISPLKWIALLFLAIGVAIVQFSEQTRASPSSQGTSTNNPLVGFIAVCAACVMSGLAGVYFEMVLKNSKTDLWIRNVQLALFSLPADITLAIMSADTAWSTSGWFSMLFSNFGLWAWAGVLMQVANGLVTALVIKHADNILKAFATSLSIILSFLFSVALFDARFTPGFLLGSSIVLGSTWMYSQPASRGSQTT